MGWFTRDKKEHPVRGRQPVPPYIENAGACVVSLNCLEGRGRVKFAARDESNNPADNGWRVFSEFDSDEYIADTDNMTVADYNTICELEPAMILVWNMPVGSDVEIIKNADGSTQIYDHRTREFISHGR